MADLYRPVRWQDVALDIGRTRDEAVWLPAVPVLGLTGLPLLPGRQEIIVERMMTDPGQLATLVARAGATQRPDGNVTLSETMQRSEVREPAILIGGDGSWLSWMLHTLPRLEQARRQTPANAHLVLGAPASPMMRQTLALLGLDAGRILVPAATGLTVFHELCLLPLINCRLADGGAMWDAGFPGQAVMPLIDAIGWSGPPARRLACVPAGWRTPAVDEHLQREGYQLLDPDALALTDLIRALRETAILLAPAMQLIGLAPFLPPESRLIEVGAGPTPHALRQIIRHIGLSHTAQPAILPR